MRAYLCDFWVETFLKENPSTNQKEEKKYGFVYKTKLKIYSNKYYKVNR